MTCPSAADAGLADRRALDRCAARPAPRADPKAAIRDAAKQFEALFMQAADEEHARGDAVLGHARQRRHRDRHRDARHAVRDQDDRPARRARRRDRAPARAPDGQPRRRDEPRRRRGRAARSSAGEDPDAAARPSCAGTTRRAQAAAAQTGIPAAFMVGQAAHESGWGRHEIRNADGTTSHNLFGIKAGAELEGRGRRGRRRPSTSDGEPRKVVARFRAYASYAESFRDYARLMKDSPRYQQAGQVVAAGTAQRLRAGPAARRLCHRPGLCRQARRA